MTIGISGDPDGLHQIIMQVNKLIDVIHCFEHTSEDAVTKEMILIKLKSSPRSAAWPCRSVSTSMARRST